MAFSWPLPLHLSTHLTGAPSGDTGVYVWNLWVFRHEVLQHQMPLQTGTVLSLAPRVDLTLHNYTLFMDALAFPLIGPLGLLRAFNVVYLAMMALTAWCTARLAYRAVRPQLGGVACGRGLRLLARADGPEHRALLARGGGAAAGDAADHGEGRGQGPRA